MERARREGQDRENANRESSYGWTDYRENGRANGNGNFIDKIVVAVRTKRFVIVTDRSPRETRFLESALISLQLKRLFILKTFVLLKIEDYTRAILLEKRRNICLLGV